MEKMRRDGRDEMDEARWYEMVRDGHGVVDHPT